MKSGPDGYRKSEKQQPEITPRFVGASKTHRALISGVGFYYHCSRKGFTDVNDQVLVEMEKFFSEVPGELGNSGYDLFNAYSNGGFEILYESMGDHTEELSEFLSEYVELMGYS